MQEAGSRASGNGYPVVRIEGVSPVFNGKTEYNVSNNSNDGGEDMTFNDYDDNEEEIESTTDTAFNDYFSGEDLVG